MKTIVWILVLLGLSNFSTAEVMECAKGSQVEFTNTGNCRPGYQPKRLLHPKASGGSLNMGAAGPVYAVPRLGGLPSTSNVAILPKPSTASYLSCEQLRRLRDYYRRCLEPNSLFHEANAMTKLWQVKDQMTAQDCRI